MPFVNAIIGNIEGTQKSKSIQELVNELSIEESKSTPNLQKIQDLKHRINIVKQHWDKVGGGKSRRRRRRNKKSRNKKSRNNKSRNNKKSNKRKSRRR